jgi:hypothetical protein
MNDKLTNPGYIVTKERIASTRVLVYAGGQYEDEIADFARLAELAEADTHIRGEFKEIADLVSAVLADAVTIMAKGAEG